MRRHSLLFVFGKAAPILPFLNDTEENVRDILDYCIQAKVYGILNSGMG